MMPIPVPFLRIREPPLPVPLQSRQARVIRTARDIARINQIMHRFHVWPDEQDSDVKEVKRLLDRLGHDIKILFDSQEDSIDQTEEEKRAHRQQLREYLGDNFDSDSDTSRGTLFSNSTRSLGNHSDTDQ